MFVIQPIETRREAQPNFCKLFDLKDKLQTGLSGRPCRQIAKKKRNDGEIADKFDANPLTKIWQNVTACDAWARTRLTALPLNRYDWQCRASSGKFARHH